MKYLILILAVLICAYEIYSLIHNIISVRKRKSTVEETEEIKKGDNEK